jgi:nucleoside-diphosphate kinase
LVGEIIRRFEAEGFLLNALKMVQVDRNHIKKHYLPTKEQLEGMGNKTLESLRAHKKNVKKIMGTEDPFELGKIINQWNETFMTSGPLVAMIFQGKNAVVVGRKIVGHTVPANADPGTIRGDFSKDSPLFANPKKRALRNLVHASGTVEEANRELKHWFSSKEIHHY